MEKGIHELKAEFEYFCVRQRKKINSFSFAIAVIIFKAYKKCSNSKRILTLFRMTGEGGGKGPPY